MKNTFIIVGTFSYSHEAHVFKTKLESTGIAVFVDFDNTGGGNPFSTINQGVTVKIREKDLHIVKDLLGEYDKENEVSSSHLKSKSISHDRMTFLPSYGCCPACDSDKIYTRKLNAIKLVISLIMVAFLLPASFTKNNFCSVCQNEWKD